MKLTLDGHTALVTGANGALGGRFARVLAGHGASVAAAARRVAVPYCVQYAMPNPNRNRKCGRDMRVI